MTRTTEHSSKMTSWRTFAGPYLSSHQLLRAACSITANLIYNYLNVVIIVFSLFHSDIKVEVSLGVLPGESRLVFRVVSEMAESRGLLIDRSSKVELLDDVSRSETEVFTDNTAEVLVIFTVLDGGVRVNPDGERVGKSNSVRNLDADSVAETSIDKRLSNETSIVSSRSIDLGGILSRVSTTSMRAPATVRIDNNLSSSESSIGSGTANIEFTGRVDDVDTLFWSANLQEVVRTDLLANLLDQSVTDGLIVDLRGVLGRDENVENSLGFEVLSIFANLVLNDNLRFTVRSQPWDLSILSLSSHLFVDSARELMRKRVEGLFIVLVSSISEHDTLISSTNVFKRFSTMDRGGDVGILGLDDLNNVHLGSVHTLIPGVEADFVNGITGNLLEVDFFLSARDFSEKA